jgi:poly(A) polymerase
MNAMYWNPISGDIYDPFDGLTDCREKLVRFIGNPVERIKHDALRSLRLVRLRATISGQYDPETYKALKDTAELTRVLSGMRILQELDKLLACPHPEIALEDLYELRILDVILPELAECKGIAQPAQFHAEGDVWNHLLACVKKFTADHGRDVRLAVLFHDIGKVQTFSVKERIRFNHHAEVSSELAEKILQRFQTPSERTKKIGWLIRHHMMMGSFKTLSDDRKAHWYFHPWFRELLELFYLDAAGTEPSDFDLYEEIIADYNEFLNTHPRPEKPLLSGDDIMELLKLEPSKELGDIMQTLYQAQVRKQIRSKEEARKFLRSLRP